MDVAGRAEGVDGEDRGNAEEGETEEDEPRLSQRLRQSDDDAAGNHGAQHGGRAGVEVEIVGAEGVVPCGDGEQGHEGYHRRAKDDAPGYPPAQAKVHSEAAPSIREIIGSY